MTLDIGQLNSQSKAKLFKTLFSGVDAELRRMYVQAFNRASETILSLIDIDLEDLTRVQRVQLLRSRNIVDQISSAIDTEILGARELIEQATARTLDESFLRSVWAVNQASGVALEWGLFSEDAVRAAIGIGDARALGGIMPEREALKHAQVLKKAFVNYDRNQRKWIAREISQGVISGDSIPKIRGRLQRALGQAGGNAQLIARTEMLRALSLGSQIAYDQAADKGVRIRQVWEATLDDRTRPDHAVMDGVARDEESGLFSTPWGSSEGPHRNGIAEQDINCRCDIRPEVEGYSPEVRRVRDEGLQPYQSFSTWAEKNGLTVNRFGQKYKF